MCWDGGASLGMIRSGQSKRHSKPGKVEHVRASGVEAVSVFLALSECLHH